MSPKRIVHSLERNLYKRNCQELLKVNNSRIFEVNNSFFSLKGKITKKVWLKIVIEILKHKNTILLARTNY